MDPSDAVATNDFTAYVEELLLVETLPTMTGTGFSAGFGVVVVGAAAAVVVVVLMVAAVVVVVEDRTNAVWQHEKAA